MATYKTHPHWGLLNETLNFENSVLANGVSVTNDFLYGLNTSILNYQQSGYRQIGTPISYEAINWYSNIQRNTGYISPSDFMAHDQFVYELYNKKIRSQMQYVMTYAGSGIGAAICPIICDVGSGSAKNYNFTDSDVGWWGLSGNGVNKCLDLGFRGADFGNYHNYHVSMRRTSIYNNAFNETVFGVRNIATQDKINVVFQKDTGTFYCLGWVIHDVGSLSSSSVGFLRPMNFAIITRPSDTGMCTFRMSGNNFTNGSLNDALFQIGSTAAYSGITSNVFAFAFNNSGINRGSFSSGSHDWMSFGYSFNSASLTPFRTCMNNLFARLGRQTVQTYLT